MNERMMQEKVRIEERRTANSSTVRTNEQRKKELQKRKRGKEGGKGRKSIISLCVFWCDSQAEHLRAVEGVARHLLDAVPGEPSVGGGAKPRSHDTHMISSNARPLSVLSYVG